MKEINLIPPEFSHSRYVRRRLTVWVELVAGVTVMVAALGLSVHGKLEAAEKENRLLAAKAQQHKQISLGLHDLAAKRRVVIEKLEAIYATQRARVYSAILYDVADACSDEVFLVELTVTDEAPRAPLFAPPRRAADAPADARQTRTVVLLKGFAFTNVDLARFVSQLSKSTNLKEVNLRLGRQETIGPLKLTKFEIECLPNAFAKD